MCVGGARGEREKHANRVRHRDHDTDNILLYLKEPTNYITTKISDFL